MQISAAKKKESSLKRPNSAQNASIKKGKSQQQLSSAKITNGVLSVNSLASTQAFKHSNSNSNSRTRLKNSTLQPMKDFYSSEPTQDIQSKYTPLRKTKDSSKKMKKKQDQVDDKENQHIYSNQKEKNSGQKQKVQKQITQGLILNENIINKLKQEVQKQVMKKDLKKIKQDQQTQTKIAQQQIKHIASVIPLEQKIKLRQQKLAQQNYKEGQLELLKSRQEYEQQQKQRQKLKEQREKERKEQMMYINLIRSSIGSSPKKKRNTHSQESRKKETLSLELEASKSNQDLKIYKDTNESNEEFDDLDKIMLHANYIKDQKDDKYSSQDREEEQLRTVQSDQNYMIKVETQEKPAYFSPFKKDQWKTFTKPFKATFSQEEAQELVMKQYRKQQFANFLKDQQQKRKNQERATNQVEEEKLNKLSQQLKMLQRDYFKGLEEFKMKQRVQSEKRLTEKKRLKKKKKQKKHKSLARKPSQSHQSHKLLDYDLQNQRNSMPQLLQTPMISSQMNMRGNFQSPQRTNMPMQYTYENYNPMLQSDDQISRQSYTPNQILLHQNNQQKPQLIDSLTSFQTMPSSKKSKGDPSQLPQQQNPIVMSQTLPKQFTLFQHHPLRNLRDNMTINSNSQTQLRNQQLKKSPIVDKNYDKTALMFEEFSKVRKELEKQLKTKKKIVKQEDRKVNVVDNTFQSKKENLKKKQKAQNLPLKVSHQPLISQNKKSQPISLRQSQNQYQQDIDKPLQQQLQNDPIQTKQLIFEKLVEVVDKVQTHFKDQIPLTNIPQQQQPFVRAISEIVKEEESKEVENELPSYICPESKSTDNKIPQITEVSQIVKKSFDEDVKNNNTTLLLRKMYSALDQEKQIKSVYTIQKYWRGYICRKILKEKIRIDREFKQLRQKYEVRSNASSNKTLLSSLAFSQSKPIQTRVSTNKLVNQDSQKLQEQYQQLSNNDFIQSDPMSSSNNSNTPFGIETFQNHNHGEQFYKKEDNEQHVQASVFKSPTVDNEQSNKKEPETTEIKPKQLQFQESQLNVPLLNSEAVYSQPQPIRKNEILANERIDEEESKDHSFVNEEISPRSQLPIEDDSPFIIKTKNAQLLPQYQKDDLYTDPSLIKPQEATNLDHHNEYLDSPLKINDLQHQQPVNQHPKGEQSQMKRLIPKPLQQDQEKNIRENEKPRDLSPNDTKSRLSQIIRQKSSFDVSSLINYGEEEKQSHKIDSARQNTQENLIMILLSKSKTSYRNKPGLLTDFSDGSPIVVEEDISPSNTAQNNSQQKNSKKTQNDSINTSVFEKNSFQQFAKDKINKVFKAEAQIEKMIEDLNKALKKKIKIKHKQLQEQELSVRTYNRKKVELEKWVEKEKRDIQATKKHFTQGCLRLSSLLENFVKEQGRVKEAVHSIRKQTSFNNSNVAVKKSHSFDGELQFNYKESQSNLSALNDNLSGEYNTVSARRISTGPVNPSFNSYVPNDTSYNKQEVPQQEEINNKQQKQQTAFEYQATVPIFDNQSPKADHTSSIIQQEEEKISDEEEQFIEVKTQTTKINNYLDTENLPTKSNNNILIDDNKKENKRLSLEDFSSLEDLSQSKDHNNIVMTIQSPNTQNENENMLFMHSNSQESNQLKLSDTPLYNREVNFPESINSLEDLEKEEDNKVEIMVDEILHNLLLKETKDKLFPKRVIPSKTIEVKAIYPPPIDNKQEINLNDINDDQIKVLDHLLEQLQPQDPDNKEINVQKSFEEDTETKEINEGEIKVDLDKKKGIDCGMLQVNTYMHDIFTRIKDEKNTLNNVLDNVSQPLYKDSILILAHLQNSMPTENEGEQPEIAYESPMPFQQSVLSVDLYLEIEKDRRGVSISQMKDSFQESNSQSFVAEMENIHNKAIFDAVNEALDGFRPYGLRGPPLPWSKSNKTLTFKYGKEETLEYLLQKVKYKVLEWAHINAGTLGDDNMSPRSKDRLEFVREDKLAKILIQEAEENEPLWTDYEYEETQTKLDIADLILEQMCKETVEILNNIKS